LGYIAISADGMTIVVATLPDEAERCNDVGLMHQGQVHRQGTPKEIERITWAEGLEVRAPDLRRATG
jgi:ABC-2 type transport system ATP-binding protein